MATTQGRKKGPLKCKNIGRTVNHAMLNAITNLIGFIIGLIPLDYLGLPIFKGRP